MAKTKIDSIKSDFLKAFPDSSVSSYDFSTDEASEASALEIVSKTGDFLRNSFCTIASSVISGEYVVKDIIKSIDSLSDVLLHDNSVEQLSVVKQNAIQKFSDTAAIVLDALNLYREFIVSFESRCNVRTPKHVVHLVKKRTTSFVESYYSELFQLLFGVCSFDMNPSYNDDVIKELLCLHTELTDIITGKKYEKEILSVCVVLRDKCMFLLKKILKSNNQDVDYLVDYHQRHIGFDEQVAPYLKEYVRRFEFYIKESYEKEPLANEIDSKVYKSQNHIWDLPLIIKYYKDKKGTTQRQVDNIIERFTQQLKDYQIEGQYDEYALSTLENYMANCHLSFLCSHCNFTLDDLVKEMDDIENIQDRTGIKNFYPFRKACLFLTSYIQSHRDEKTFEMDGIMDRLEYYIGKFESALIWCKEQDYIPIQVPFKGCLVKNNPYGVVFVPSTYCRPLQYEKHFDELNKAKMDVLLLRSEARIQEDKNEIDKLKAQIDNSNKRLIEIFTLFVTIAAFIFGSIEFFASSQSEGLQSMLKNTVSLGVILLLFSSSVSLVTIGKDFSFKQPRCIIAMLVFLVFLALFITQLCVVY